MDNDEIGIRSDGVAEIRGPITTIDHEELLAIRRLILELVHLEATPGADLSPDAWDDVRVIKNRLSRAVSTSVKGDK